MGKENEEHKSLASEKEKEKMNLVFKYFFMEWNEYPTITITDTSYVNESGVVVIQNTVS
jgi:hypothetical protein